MRVPRTTPFTFALTLGLLALASSAAAQVAAPGLLPDAFVTPNPAAMQWGGESRLGASYSQTAVNPSGADYDTESERVGLRALGKWGGLGLEWEHQEETSGDNSIDADQQRGAFSVMALSWLAIGVLYQESAFKQDDPAGILLDAQSQFFVYGASLRLFDLLYVGYAQGREDADIEISANLVPGLEFKFSDSREARAWGLGLRGGKDWRYHLEYYEIEFDAFEFGPNAFSPAGGEIDKHRDSRTVLEIGWRGIVLGAALTEVDEDSSNRDTRVQRYSLAWIPAVRFALVYANEASKSEDQNTGDTVEERETHSLSVVYLF